MAEAYETHAECNVVECVARLLRYMPTFSDLTPDRKMEWYRDFGARAASACCRAMDVLYQRDNGITLPSFRAEMERVSGVMQHERTKAYIADQRQQATAAIAERGNLRAWVRGLDPADREKLREQAVNATRAPAALVAKWMDLDPCESITLAGLMQAHYRKIRSEYGGHVR